MKDETSVTKEEDLEIVEIAEFKINDPRKHKLRQEEQERSRRQELCLILALYVVGFLAAALICIFAFQLPAVVVCIVLILEAMIAACVYEGNAGVHLLEIAIGLAAGIVYGRILLMFVGALVYLGTVAALRMMRSLR